LEAILRKTFITIIIILFVIFLGGCNKDKTGYEKVQLTVTPSAQPMVTQPVVTLPDEDTSGSKAKQDMETLELGDYFPIQADTECVYEGKGNEYASYNVFTDYVDADNNKMQTRTNNGGTETVRVIQIKDGKATVIYKLNECYYRENFLNKTASKKSEVLLMEPIAKGTKWTLPDGRKRYISAVNVNVSTPGGKYKAIEVTTKDKSGTTRDYYAPKVGLVKSTFGLGEGAVSSTLSKINTNKQFVQTIDVYYPDTNEKLHVKPLKLSFRTGDVTRLVLQKALREQAVKESALPLISTNTKINSLYLGKGNIVYVDFSKSFVEDMNLGSGFEAAVLQCITNTLGNYYGVEKVYITIEGKPYESGHIVMKKGETFRVNTKEVVR
jgi:hypothetical protein